MNKLVKRRRMTYKIKKANKQERLRLSIYKTNNNLYAQIIDDKVSKTLVSASTLKMLKGYNIEAAIELGKVIGEKAKEISIGKVVFDRGSFKYHGRVKAFAEKARENLEF